MGTLERYQKKGGFSQIVSLIESSEPEKAKKFLTIIASESPIWEQAIRNKSLSIVKIADFAERLLTEALVTLPANIIAVALTKEPLEVRTKFFNALGGNIQKKIENADRDNPEPRAGEIIACQLKIISAIRAAITDGRIKQNQLPTELQIADNIETQLANETWSASLQVTPLKVSEPLAPKGQPTVNHEDTLDLKRKIHHLIEENQSLKGQLQEAQNRLQQIKKWVS